MRNYIKIRIILFCLCLYGGNLFSQIFYGDLTDKDSIPNDIQHLIKAVKEPSVFKEIPYYFQASPPAKIKKQQAHEDIEMIQYLFDNAYSGRYYWEQNGFDFENCYKKLHSYIDTLSSADVDVRVFEDYIFSCFSEINDGHTVFLGFGFHQLAKRIIPYYSEIIVENHSNRYFVIESKQSDVVIGMEYTGIKEYLRKTMSKNGTEQFLIAVLSDSAIENINLSFDSETKNIRLHPSRLTDIDIDRWDIIVQIDTLQSIPVVRSSNFSPQVSMTDFSWSYQKSLILNSFVDYGKELKDKPVFIWNIMGNWGGDDQYPTNFIKNFNDISEESAYYLTLHSPAVNQCYWPNKNGWITGSKTYMKALNDDSFPLDSISSERQRERVRKIRIEKQHVKTNPVKYWDVTLKPEDKKGNYKGLAILLVNNITGSAANNAIGASKCIPNSIIIGENTASSYAIGNMKWYKLENSNIVIWLPGLLIFHPDNKMEKGFFPDYWIDSDHPEEEIIRWIKNPDNYQFSYVR